MALVKVYRELDKRTRATKDMAVSSKHAHKHAKTAMELWQALESQRDELEQRLNEKEQENSLALRPLAPNHVNMSTQIKDTTESVPTTETTKVSLPNYEEDLAAKSMIGEKAKQCYEVGKVEADQIRE